MTMPRNPQIDYEQELKIVRKFLKRNNINDLMLALASWGVQPHVVRVVGYKGDIVSGLNVAPSVDFSRDIDTDGYFDSTHKDRLTVPLWRRPPGTSRAAQAHERRTPGPPRPGGMVALVAENQANEQQ